MNNKQTTKLKIGICIGIVIILIASVFFVMSIQNTKGNANELAEDITMAEGSQNKPTESSDNEYKIDVVESVVFDLNEVDFKFAIVKLRVQGSTAINLPLNHFTTSEGVNLGEVDSYVTKLENQSLFLGKQNVWYEILSNENQTMVNIFVPIKDKNAKEIILNNDLGIDALEIKIGNSKGTAEMLQYQADDIITDGKTYQMTVSSAYPITGDTMYQNNQEYLLPSTVEVYAFNIQAVSLWGDTIVVEEAKYVPENSKEVFNALDSSIQSMKYSNIINKQINEKDTGDLFFVAYSPIESPVTYKGVLQLKIKGSDNWVTINVDLN